MADHKTILFYTDTPNIGGAENQMYLLAKFLDKDKYNVMLVCSDNKNLDDWAAKFEREEVLVERLNVIHKHDPRHYMQLKEILRKNEIDLMHIHIWNPASCRYALKLAKKYKMPTVITEHDPFKLPKLKHFVKNRLIENVDHIIAVSIANNEFLNKLWPLHEDRISTVYNGIDVTWFESQLLSFNEKKREDFRLENFEVDSNETQVILTVAELHERKGIKHLLKALPKVIEKHKDCKLIIAGDGPQKEQLMHLTKNQKIEKHVKFIGFRKDIPQIMASADLFVLPSEKEAFGLVLLEAMAAYLPIIASEVGGIPEIIKDGVNGALVPPKDHEKLADKILEFFNNNLKVKEYIKAGGKILKENFDVKAMAKNTQNIYDDVLNRYK